MSITVTPRLHARAVKRPGVGGGFAIISVPGASGRREFRIRTRIFLDTAGRIVLG
jgi:hypothetical protein